MRAAGPSDGSHGPGEAGLVSVVVPVFNGARYLAESLDSALAQDYPQVEVIVVDDGSTDATPEVLARYGDRVRVIRQPNQGAAVARNAALRVARGEYLAFLDADDRWLPHKLRIQIAHLRRNPQVDLVYSSWSVVERSDPQALDIVGPEPREEDAIDPGGSGWIYNALLLDCIVHTTTVVMRRRLLDAVGLFDPELRRGQDYDFWLRASRVTPIHKLAAVLSIYRLHDANSTRDPVPINYSGEILQRALQRWGRTGPDGTVTDSRSMQIRLARSWGAFGYEHARAGHTGIALKAFARSIAQDPLQPRVWALAAATALPGARRLLWASEQPLRRP